MPDWALIWGKFSLAVAVIAVAGSALSRNGDAIAQRTGLSGSWIGLLLLATATSLPELFTGVSAVRLANAPDIAVGDVFGSCIFNLAVIVVLDALHRGHSVFDKMDESHLLMAAFGIILIGFGGAGLLLAPASLAPSFLQVSVFSPLLILLYLLALRAIFYFEAGRPKAEGRKTGPSLGKAIAGYTTAAAFVVGAGAWLPFIGQDLANATGLGQTFVGTLMIAFATSVPEVVVSASALRIGALDMAIANLLGSNLFNMLVLAIDDIAYVHGSLLEVASKAHATTAFMAMIMSGIVIVALLHRPGRRFFGAFSWASLALAAVYFLGSYVTYLYGR
ncbi:hypothetical protein [Methylocystis echinoides]|uniref:sodium:calcium antiporter n=1 Tax=Methylocystis echinoides TaxID=29468 RepID=UPI00342222BC